jgi:hypothetical protein
MLLRSCSRCLKALNGNSRQRASLPLCHSVPRVACGISQRLSRGCLCDVVVGELVRCSSRTAHKKVRHFIFLRKCLKTVILENINIIVTDSHGTGSAGLRARTVAYSNGRPNHSAHSRQWWLLDSIIFEALTSVAQQSTRLRAHFVSLV